MFTAVPSKSPGDVYSATPMWNTYLKDNLNKGVVRPIAETTLGSPAASITFSSIAADWSHLMLVVAAAGDTAANNVNLLLRLNGDTGANYYYEHLTATNTTVAAAEGLGQTSLLLSEIPAGTASGGGHVGLITIPLYAASAIDRRAVMTDTFVAWNNSTGTVRRSFSGGWWNNSVAVTSLTLLPSTGNLKANTKATLYGMGGI